MNIFQRKMLAFSVLFSCLGLTGGCAHVPAERTVPKYWHPNVPVQRRVGEKFILILPSNPSTGYTWELAEPVDGKILRLVNSEYRSSDPQIPGRSGEEHWTFQGVGKGKTSVKLEYTRVWEKNISPVRKAAFEVTIE